ncbi:unnamed protein product, partial [Ectocarpus sp. 12 AP-2014]
MTDTAFWDRIAPKYAKSPISNLEAYEKTLERVRSYLKKSDTVLELGCGTGSTALLLAGNVASYTGTDISSRMIAIAKEKLEDEPTPGLTFKVAGTARVDHSGTSPNTILAFNLFHLVPELETALEEAHAMLPTGGHLISKTPALGEKWYYRPLIKIMQMVGKAPYARVFTM